VTSPVPVARSWAASIVPAALLALGLLGAGAFIGANIPRLRTADRTVTVKGVAEREAQADLAIWPLRLVATDDDLVAANARLAANAQSVRTFLTAQGLGPAPPRASRCRTSPSPTRAATRGATPPGAGSSSARRSSCAPTDVARVQAAAQRVADLVGAGVVLSSGQEYGGGGPTFLFTKLDALKAPMIAEATAQARRAAEQFARDSHSALGGIRSASQGYFEILPRDQAPGISQESQVVKTVRVVTTVAYALDD
jgi:hypothetical protein